MSRLCAFWVIQKFIIFLYFANEVMINCSKFVCSKNLLDTILLLLDSIRAIIIFLVNWSTAILNLLSCRINWIRAIDKFCVEQLISCQKCRANDCRAIKFRAVHPHSKLQMKSFWVIQLIFSQNAFLRFWKWKQAH